MGLNLTDDIGILEENLFEPIFKRTLALEGGYTVDEGGATNLGITQTLLDAFNKQQKLPSEDVRLISKDKARIIYDEEFYKRPKYDKLPPKVGSLQFDFGVQSSPKRATKSLQKIIGADVDGVVGSQTIKATQDYIKEHDEKNLLQKLIDDRVDFLKKTPAFKTKSKGLMNRINKIKKEFDLSKLNPFAVTEAQASTLQLEDDLGIYEQAKAPKLEDDLQIFAPPKPEKPKVAPRGLGRRIWGDEESLSPDVRTPTEGYDNIRFEEKRKAYIDSIPNVPVLRSETSSKFISEEDREELNKKFKKEYNIDLIKEYPTNLYSGVPSWMDAFAQGVLPLQPQPQPELENAHPFSNFAGKLTGLAMMSGMTAGIAPATHKALLTSPQFGMWSRIYPSAARMVAKSAQRGALWGGKEGLDQLARTFGTGKEISPGEIASASAFGLTSGLMSGIEGTALRIAMQGVGRGAWVAGDTLLKKNKIESEDMMNIALNAALGSAIEAINAPAVTKAYKKAKWDQFMTDQNVSRIMSRTGKSRAEAEASAKMINFFAMKMKPAAQVIVNNSAPAGVLKESGKYIQVQYYNKIAEAMEKGAPVKEALFRAGEWLKDVSTTFSEVELEAVKKVEPVERLEEARIQPQFNNPNDPVMLDYLSRYMDPKKVATMTPQMRLTAGNMQTEELRDLASELEEVEPTVTPEPEAPVPTPEKPEVVPPAPIPQGKQGIVEPVVEVPKKKLGKPIIMTEEEYLTSKGAVRLGGADAALHRTPGGFPKGVREKLLADVQAKMKKNNKRREVLRKEYAEKVDSGEIQPPSRIEKLIQTARGDEDLESTQAARRLLEKQGTDWEKPTEIPAKEPVSVEAGEEGVFVGEEQLQANIETNAKQLGISVEEYNKRYLAEPTETPNVSFVNKIQAQPIDKFGPQLNEDKGQVRLAADQEEASELEGLYEKQKDIWIGNKDVRISLEIPTEKRQIQTAIKTVAGERKYGERAKGYDMAIQLYIDSKRNPQQVQELYSELTAEQQKLVDLSQNLPPDVLRIADRIEASYRELGIEALDKGVIRNILDNYAGRIWDIEGRPATQKFRKFGIKTRHAKQRRFDTIVEGWAQGYKLKVIGSSNNLAILKEEIVKTIEDKKFIESLKKIKDVDGNPLVTTKYLPGYKKIDHPNFKTWKYAGRAIPDEVYGRNAFVDNEGNLFERQEMYAPRSQANNLNNILGVSMLKGIKALDVVTKYNAILKAWILQTSLFHHMAFARSYYLGTNRKKFKEMNPIDAVNDGNRMVDELSPVIVQGVRSGLTLGRKQDWNEDLLKEKTAIGLLLDQWGVSREIKNKILDLRQGQADFLFGVVGSGLKAKAYAIEFRNQVKKYPSEDIHVIAKRVANLINDDFGGLHLQRMGRNPTVQHIFRLLALAPDWTESNIRTMVKSFKGGREGKMYRNFWAGILAKGLMATILANLVMAAFDEDDVNAEGVLERFYRNYRKAGRAGKYKWLDVDITPIYKAFGGTGDERYYFSILGHFKDPLKLSIRNDRAKKDQRLSTFKLGNTRAMKYKASVIGGMALDYITGTDYAERRFTTFKELAGVDYGKGEYKTTRKGKYKKGDPRWGKLKRQTVVWDYGKRGSIEFEQMPSFLLNQAKGVQPVQIQQMMNYTAGELDGFIALGNALGLGIRKTYGEKPEEMSRLNWARTPREKKRKYKGGMFIKRGGLWNPVSIKRSTKRKPGLRPRAQ